MQKLLEQFEVLEKQCSELLYKYKAIQQENNELTKANKLLKKKYSSVNIDDIVEQSREEEKDYNKEREPINKEIEMYVNEIDECLEILKTIN